MLKVWLFLVCGGFFGLSQQKDIKMFIYDFKITTIESIVNNASIVTKCSVNTRENPCDYTPKVYFTFVKEIPRPYLHFKITDLTTSINLVDQTVLLCAFTGANGLDTLMKTWWEKMLKNMDFPIKCPFPAGSHSVNSFDQSSMKMFFTIAPKNRELMFTLILKVRQGKKIVDALVYTEKIQIIDG